MSVKEFLYKIFACAGITVYTKDVQRALGHSVLCSRVSAFLSAVFVGQFVVSFHR